MKCPILVSTTCLFLWASYSLGFQFDVDKLDDCKEREAAGKCTADSTTFFQCPIACTENLKSAGMRTQGEAHEPDDFFQLEVPISSTQKLSFDRFEGYITLVVVLPLVPGMAQYYYEMMEHIHSVYPYTLEMVMFPVRRDDYPDLQIKIKPDTKLVWLPELAKNGDKIESNPVLEYLEHTIYPGSNAIFTDRVTTYIVSYNAGFVEKEASPTLKYLEGLIEHYRSEMDWKYDL